MKKKLIIIGLGISALALTGCGMVTPNDTYAPKNGLNRWSYVQELPDGRSVVCAAANDALTCDWSNAR